VLLLAGRSWRLTHLDWKRRRAHVEPFERRLPQDAIDVFEERLKDNTVSPVPDQAAFRIDYPAWLSQLGPPNCDIAEDMALDLGTFELAAKHKISAGRISQLRRELHQDWRRFHGEVC
jgi:hypothetical protein